MTREKLKIPPNGKPDYPLMMLATVIALKDLGGSGTNNEIAERIIKNEEITEEEQTYMMPDGIRTRIDFNLPWARTCLNGVGYLENIKKSVWALTEAGFNINTLEDATRVGREYNEMIVERRLARTNSEQQEHNPVNNEINPPVEHEASYEITNHDDDWKTTLLETLGSIEPSAFERLSQRLLREAGFVKVEVRGKAGDGGIDGIGILPINLLSFHVYFQCKRWKGSVGPNEIRDFRGALEGRAGKGLFITTGSFTSSAKEEATRDGAIPIDLIDGDRLCDLLKDNKLGIKTKMVEKVTIDHEYFNDI